MTAIIRPNLHHTMAESIYEKIQNKTALYYYYIGKSLAWADETSPELPVNSNSYEMDARNNLIFLKQVTLNDVAFTTNRIDWTSGTIYDMYDDSYTNENPLDQRNFYVLTDEFNVYKVISNNSGVASTVKPTGTDTTYIIHSTDTQDGYIWKYMYSLPLALRNKFLTAASMPVPREVKNKYYSQGTIASFTLTHGGSGYTDGEAYAVITGDGSGAAATLAITAGSITGLTITNAGTGYTNVQLTVMTGAGEGSGADITLNISNPGNLDTNQANVESLTVDRDISFGLITASSAGFTTNPVVTITGDGTGAAATTVRNGTGNVVGLTFTNRGSGYSFATISITSESLGGGVTATATARAIISPIGGHGSNAPRELHADTLAFYASFEDELNHTLEVSNDYRQFGIIKDIDKYSATEKYNSTVGTGCFLLEGTLTAASYALDSVIHTSGNAKTLRVVAVVNNKILVQSVDGSVPATSDVFFNAGDTANFTVTTITAPTINKFTGEVLFIDNRSAFTPSDEQIVIFRTFIRF